MKDDIIHHHLIQLNKIIVLTKMIIVLISIILNKDDRSHPTNPLAKLLFVRGEEQLSVGSPGFIIVTSFVEYGPNIGYLVVFGGFENSPVLLSVLKATVCQSLSHGASGLIGSQDTWLSG